MGEVDATGEGDVVVGRGQRRPVDHDDLLVMAPAAADAMVEHELTARVVDRAREAQVAELSRRVADRMRAPEQASQDGTAPRRIGEHGADLGTRASETFVAVALEIGEVQPVAGARRADLVEQAREVLGAVDQHA